MTDVTQIISEIERGDSGAADRLLPLVYNELRRLAAAKLAQEKPGQTLQATALVHDAYLRLVGPAGNEAPCWENRGHFFTAAAEAELAIIPSVAGWELARHQRIQWFDHNRWRLYPSGRLARPASDDQPRPARFADTVARGL